MLFYLLEFCKKSYGLFAEKKVKKKYNCNALVKTRSGYYEAKILASNYNKNILESLMEDIREKRLYVKLENMTKATITDGSLNTLMDEFHNKHEPALVAPDIDRELPTTEGSNEYESKIAEQEINSSAENGNGKMHDQPESLGTQQNNTKEGSGSNIIEQEINSDAKNGNEEMYDEPENLGIHQNNTKKGSGSNVIVTEQESMSNDFHIDSKLFERSRCYSQRFQGVGGSGEILTTSFDDELQYELDKWDERRRILVGKNILDDQYSGSRSNEVTPKRGNLEEILPPPKLNQKKKPKKPHCCFYCNKVTVTLTRHLKTKHADEPDVILAMEEAAATMKSSGNASNRVAVKHSAFAKIRKRGDLKYNEENTGEERIVVKRTYVKDSSLVAEREDCICFACHGVYSANNFRNHRSKDGKCKRTDSEINKNLIGVAKIACLKLPAIASPILKEKIYPHFTKLKQKEIIFYDPVLIAYGNAMCIKYFQTNNSSQNYKQISSSLRLMADLLIETRQLDKEVHNFDDMLYAHKRDIVTEAIRKRCGYSEDGFRSPSTALELCNILSKVCNIMKGLAADERNYELAKRYEECDSNMKNQRNIYITRTARENRVAIQRRKLEILPTTAEIRELIHVLQRDLLQYISKLKEDANVHNYKLLAKTILVYLMVFNRKRPVDIHNWRVDEYKEENQIDEDDLQSVPEADRENLRYLRRCQTRHKLNRNEAILVPPDVREGLNILLCHRDIFIQDKSNKYIFAHPTGKRSPIFRADDCLRQLCIRNHLDHTTLKSTKLRKHLATCTASLSRDTQQHLSKFMSHNEGIHYDIYQRRTTTDITVVGRILNHAAGISPGGFNVTTEINQSNRSIEEVIDAPWLTEDDLLDNEASGCDEQLINDCSTPSNESRLEKTQTRSEFNTSSKRKSHFPIDIALTKKRKYDFDLKKKSPDAVSQTWTSFQKEKVCEIFSEHINNKQAPSLAEIQNKMNINHISLDKTFIQIQAWIRAEIERRKKHKTGRGWSSEESNALRQYFSNYYKLTQQRCSNVYPSSSEIEKALSSVPLLRSKTVESVKSKFQNDFRHLLRKLRGQKENLVPFTIRA